MIHPRNAVGIQSMRSRRPASLGRVAALASAWLTSLLIGAAAARAEERGDDDRAGFSGFIEAAPHVIVQRARGSVDPNFAFSQSRKSNIVTNLTFRLGGGVKAPALSSLPGQPRPVLFAAALVPINESSTIGSKLVETNPPGGERVEDSKFSIEYKTSAILGLGLEFQVPVLDFEIAVTPSIQSLHLLSRYVGRASLSLTGAGVNQENRIGGKQDITQHFLGPALRIATPSAFVRGVAVGFFLDAGLLLDVAGTHERFAVDGSPNSSGKFNFETGSGVASVTSGFQVRWP